MIYTLRYSIVHRGDVVARRSLRYKAASAEHALQIGADWLCRYGLAFRARITSLRPA